MNKEKNDFILLSKYKTRKEALAKVRNRYSLLKTNIHALDEGEYIGYIFEGYGEGDDSI